MKNAILKYIKKLSLFTGIALLIFSVGWFSIGYFSKNKGPKLILLGIDGADWDIIDHYIIEGRLPTFSRLKREGAWGYLRSFDPMLSPMLWTTIATGKRPDEHGIVDFLEWDEQKRERLPVTSNHKKMPSIWNILSQHGFTSGIFNWLVTWPAEKINGVMVSDRLGYHIFPRIIGPRLTLERVSYPVQYAEQKKKLFSAPEKITYPEIAGFIQISEEEFKEQSGIGQYDVENPDMNLRLALATFKTFKNSAFDYWRRKKPSFLALYFDIPDTLMHTFIDYAPPKLERVSLRQFQKYQNAVRATYEKLDEFLSELLKLMDSQTHLILVSDHGFKFGEERLKVPATIGKDNEVYWHDKEGIVAFWGERFQKSKQILAMDLYDIVPTILHFFGLPIAQDMSGKLISEAFKKDFFNPDHVRYTASYNDTPFGLIDQAGSSPARQAEIDQATKEKLASLGYIQMDEEKEQKNRFQTRNPFLEAVQLQKAGHVDEAVEMYVKILKEEPDTKNALSIYNSLALIYKNRGNYPNAKKYIQKAIERDKTLSSVYVNLGNIEKQFDYDDMAYRAYQKAIALDPQDGMAYYAMGLLFEKQKKWESAERYFQMAIQRKIEMPALPSQIMTLLEKQHKTAELKKMHEHFSMERSPEQRFQFFINESQRYLNSNRLQEALEALFEALRLQPKSATLYNDIGGVFLRRNDKIKAIAYFKKAIELDPGHILAYLNLASAYLESRQLDMAKDYLNKVLKLDPRNKHAYYLLGITQMKSTEHRLAKFSFQKALQLDPAFAEAKEKLKQLQK